jgi:hypothetical protein
MIDRVLPLLDSRSYYNNRKIAPWVEAIFLVRLLGYTVAVVLLQFHTENDTSTISVVAATVQLLCDVLSISVASTFILWLSFRLLGRQLFLWRIWDWISRTYSRVQATTCSPTELRQGFRRWFQDLRIDFSRISWRNLRQHRLPAPDATCFGRSNTRTGYERFPRSSDGASERESLLNAPGPIVMERMGDSETGAASSDVCDSYHKRE